MNSFDHDSLKKAAMHLLIAKNFAWLVEKRWFADKGRAISDIDIVDLTVSELAEVTVLLTIVEVTFQSGGSATYFAPLMIADESEPDRVVGNRASDGPALVDAVSQPEFGRWMAKLLSNGGERVLTREWFANSVHRATGHFQDKSNLDAKSVGAEQSNSSIRISDDVVVKILRRIYSGENPEDEVLRALSGSSQARVSAYLGSLYWQAAGGPPYTVAIAQTWVPNRGDGWTWILERLRRVGESPAVDPVTISASHDLGKRTAELHLALSAAQGKAFGRRSVTNKDVSQAQTAFLSSLARSRGLVSEGMSALPKEFKQKVPEIVRLMSGLNVLASGFAEEVGTARIRVHGDYHLGQVLRTVDDDWTIIDFEGEPARTLEERRERSSALRDVAGMLRSFSYARAVVAQELHAGATERDALMEWELTARDAFVSGYRAAFAPSTPHSGVPLVPSSENAFWSALAAWEADKALYEVAYEARNRPGWIAIPLRSLIPDLSGQS